MRQSHEWWSRGACVVVAALACLALIGCSSDDGVAPAVPDVVEDTAPDVGPSDDAERVDVEVPVINRRFRMSIAAPAEGQGSAWFERSWARATTDGDVLTIWMNAGLPWVEILDDSAPLPPQFETELAELVALAEDAGLPVLLIVDLLNDSRDGFRGDLYGREVPALQNATFADTVLRDAYAAFCADLLDRLAPTFFVPIVAPNQYGATVPSDYESFRLWYTSLSTELTLGRPISMFPVWDFWSLRSTQATRNEAELQVFTRIDELQSLFAVTLDPAQVGVRLGDLSVEDFRFLDKEDTAANPISSRGAAFVGASFPAEGFTLNGVAYPSSENSQFNFLALVFEAAEAIGMELVVWRAGVDPDAWLADPCADPESCDLDAIESRWIPLRSNGLYGTDDRARPAAELWEETAARTLSTGR